MTEPRFNTEYSAQFYNYTGKDIPWLLKKWEDATPDKTFLTWEPKSGEPKTWTYRAFWQEVNQVACGLIARGVTKGDKLLIHSNNSPEMMIAWYASALIGSCAVTTNIGCIGEELTYFAEHSEAVGCITQPEFIESLKENAKNIPWFIVTDDNSGEAADATQLDHGQGSWQSLYEHGTEAPTRPAEPMLPVGVQFTSGTTSRPKAVVLTHANALWGGMTGSQNLGIDSSDTYLCFLPCFHINGLSWTFWTMMYAGGSIVLQPKFSASRFWELSVKYNCTRATMIPFCFKAIGAQEIPKHSYKSWSTGIRLHNVENYWKVPTFATWGMTETITHATRSNLVMDCPEMNIGLPTPGYEFAILNAETGAYCQPGENGDLYIRGVRGVHIFLEYFKNPEAMKKSFTSDGWFKTGDTVRLGEDGYFYFADRDKDILKVGGENVSARQIEEFIGALLGMGVLEEYAVVAQKHDMLDEVPVLFAIKSPWTQLTEEDIRNKVLQGCEEGLASFKCPKAVYFVDDMPRAALEKIAKNKLREIADSLADEDKIGS